MLPRRTIQLADDGFGVDVLDQTRLPFDETYRRLTSLDEAATAIRDMIVRGAPLIGATAAYGLALALRQDASDAAIDRAVTVLGATRPTAVNLAWALRRVADAVRAEPDERRADRAFAEAALICDEDVESCRAIGRYGLELLHARCGTGTLRLMTHCNAGALATVNGGTALAPIYAAHEAGHSVHVWVSETRPRNQGAALTAWELDRAGIAHTVVADNACGYLMDRGAVDGVIVGADRIAANGDVANKVGTLLKALAAREFEIPFVVAAPRSTVDERCPDGRAIEIEERDGHEVANVFGRDPHGAFTSVRVIPDGSPTANPAFDVTPAHFVTAIVTEVGVWRPGTGARPW